MEIDNTISKKRLPSGSPDGENWNDTGSSSGSYDEAIDAMEELNTLHYYLTNRTINRMGMSPGCMKQLSSVVGLFSNIYL